MAASFLQSEIKHKRQREKFSEDFENLAHKRSRDGLLSELFSPDDDGDVDNDLVLQVFKSLQDEISGDSAKEKYMSIRIESSDVGERVLSSYEDVLNATDDQLGIQENDDDDGISNKFWSDLFESPSNSAGGSLDHLHPFLSHCYSYNNRSDYIEYHTFLISEDQQDWIDETFADLASQSCLNPNL